MSKIVCLMCGKELESKHRHDFQRCDCPNETFVDGGNDYTRVGGKELKYIDFVDDNAPVD
jgi:hypothetical protein